MSWPKMTQLQIIVSCTKWSHKHINTMLACVGLKWHKSKIVCAALTRMVHKQCLSCTKWNRKHMTIFSLCHFKPTQANIVLTCLQFHTVRDTTIWSCLISSQHMPTVCVLSYSMWHRQFSTQPTHTNIVLTYLQFHLVQDTTIWSCLMSSQRMPTVCWLVYHPIQCGTDHFLLVPL
jgi:hypothetical protein